MKDPIQSIMEEKGIQAKKMSEDQQRQFMIQFQEKFLKHDADLLSPLFWSFKEYKFIGNPNAWVWICEFIRDSNIAMIFEYSTIDEPKLVRNWYLLKGTDLKNILERFIDTYNEDYIYTFYFMDLNLSNLICFSRNIADNRVMYALGEEATRWLDSLDNPQNNEYRRTLTNVFSYLGFQAQPISKEQRDDYMKKLRDQFCTSDPPQGDKNLWDGLIACGKMIRDIDNLFPLIESKIKDRVVLLFEREEEPGVFGFVFHNGEELAKYLHEAPWDGICFFDESVRYAVYVDEYVQSFLCGEAMDW